MTETITFTDFNKIYCNKYTVLQLKKIGDKFNIKWKSKKKADVQQECFTFLKKRDMVYYQII